MQQAHKLSFLRQHLAQKNITDPAFLMRIGANFPIVYDLFEELYAYHPYKAEAFENLFEVLTRNFENRPEGLKALDLERMSNPDWFCSEKMVGMMLYVERFNKDFKGLKEKLPYLKNLGINTLHLMPFLDVADTENDGGYSVKDYRKIRPSLGTMEDFESFTKELHKQKMSVIADFVLNHSADSHEWAMKAKHGDEKYKEYYYFFKGREIPDEYEKTMTEIFPDTAPGNFTWVEEQKEWVMTLFHN